MILIVILRHFIIRSDQYFFFYLFLTSMWMKAGSSELLAALWTKVAK